MLVADSNVVASKSYNIMLEKNLNNYGKSGHDDHPDENGGVPFTELVEIGRRLAQFAKEKYGSKTVLIEKLQIEPEEAIKYFSYRKPIHPDVLIKLSNLGCSIDWLLTGKGVFSPGAAKTSRSDEGFSPSDHLKFTDAVKLKKEKAPPESTFNSKILELEKELQQITHKNNHLLEELVSIKGKVEAEVAAEKADKRKSEFQLDDEKLDKIINFIIDEIKDAELKAIEKLLTRTYDNFQKDILSVLNGANEINKDKIRKILQGK